MGERKLLAFGVVMHEQEPAAQALVNAVYTAAGMKLMGYF